MPSEFNKQLQQILAPTMKAAGYRKSGATWHFTDPDFIRVLNIQGSQWGSSFYLNMGIYIRAIGEKAKPCEYDCHLRSRVESKDRAVLNAALNFENPISISDRSQVLVTAIESIALPWLEGHASKEGITRTLTAQSRSNWAISKLAWPYAGVLPPA